MTAPDHTSNRSETTCTNGGIHAGTDRLTAGLAYPRADVCDGCSDGYAKGGEAVQDTGVDMEFRELTVEVSRQEAEPSVSLRGPSAHTMHFGFGVASAVTTASSSPDGTAKGVKRRAALRAISAAV